MIVKPSDRFQPDLSALYQALSRLSASFAAKTSAEAPRPTSFKRKRAGARQRRAKLTPWPTEADRRAKIRALRREVIPRPAGLHKATYRRLLREHDRMLLELDRLPYRRTWDIVRERLETQLLNRLHRIRRRLGLRVPRPPQRQWYRTSAAAVFVGISSKTLLRWTAQGHVRCERSPWGHRQRRYRHSDLVALVKDLRI